MTREEAIELLVNATYSDEWQGNEQLTKANLMAIEALQADPVSEDTQTEERARFVAKETELAHIEARLENAEKRLQELPKYTNCTGFIEWLTEVVLNDKDWELNAVAYGEVICRKLVKLGVLEVTEEPSYYIRPSALQAEPVKHGEWEKNEPLPSEWQYKCSECGVPSKSNSHKFCPNCGAKMKGIAGK